MTSSKNDIIVEFMDYTCYKKDDKTWSIMATDIHLLVTYIDNGKVTHHPVFRVEAGDVDDLKEKLLFLIMAGKLETEDDKAFYTI